MPETYDYLKLLSAFGIVIIFLYAIYYYVSNFGGFRTKDGKIKLIETKPIGKNRFLVYIEVEGTKFLLSSDESGIRILKEWSEEERS